MHGAADDFGHEAFHCQTDAPMRSVLEWDQEGEQIIVRRSARYTSEDVHRAVFAKGRPKRRTLNELKAGIRRHVRERHAGR